MNKTFWLPIIGAIALITFWSAVFQEVSAEDNCLLYNDYVLLLNIVYLLEALTK